MSGCVREPLPQSGFGGQAPTLGSQPRPRSGLRVTLGLTIPTPVSRSRFCIIGRKVSLYMYIYSERCSVRDYFQSWRSVWVARTDSTISFLQSSWRLIPSVTVPVWRSLTGGNGGKETDETWSPALLAVGSRACPVGLSCGE